MRAKSRGIVGALALLLPMAAICAPWGVPSAAAQVPLGPHADLPCSACHLPGPDGSPLLPVALVADQEFLCAECHPDAITARHAASHPSGFVPKRALPAGFPLDAQGRLTCSSCHDLHGQSPILLRGGAAWSCEQCHPR